MAESLVRIALVATGGALGATARVVVSSYLARVVPGTFPWGTLSVNLAGALLFGMVWAILDREPNSHALWRMFLLGGFLGAFTTFSTLAFEGSQLLAKGRLLTAFLYVGVQNLIGLALVFVGFAAGDLILRLMGGASR